MHFAVTGKQSVERLVPLIHQLLEGKDIKLTDKPITDNYIYIDHGKENMKTNTDITQHATQQSEVQTDEDHEINNIIVGNKTTESFLSNNNINSSNDNEQHVLRLMHSTEDKHDIFDFVWETTCFKSNRKLHSSAKILNKLNNTNIIECKSNLAFLQLEILKTYPNCILSFVANNGQEVEEWGLKRWNKMNEIIDYDCDWWVVKASKGNGGRDVWIVNKSNFQQVLPILPNNDEYVIQKYIRNPLLLNGKKFHFRCYSAMMADMTCYVYQKAFLLTASLDYDCNDDNVRKHITNLSINKRYMNHPGQIPCNVAIEYPQVYEQIKKLWSAVVTAASTFMKYQTNKNNFEFFGIDVIADTDGHCWLIEANRLPGLESSKNNKDEEDLFYNEMMISLLKILPNQ
eukprot:gene9454-12738_t